MGLDEDTVEAAVMERAFAHADYEKTGEVPVWLHPENRPRVGCQGVRGKIWERANILVHPRPGQERLVRDIEKRGPCVSRFIMGDTGTGKTYGGVTLFRIMRGEYGYMNCSYPTQVMSDNMWVGNIRHHEHGKNRDRGRHGTNVLTDLDVYNEFAELGVRHHPFFFDFQYLATSPVKKYGLDLFMDLVDALYNCEGGITICSQKGYTQLRELWEKASDADKAKATLRRLQEMCGPEIQLRKLSQQDLCL